MSRRAEIGADRHAAQTGDAQNTARALLLIGAANLLFEERVNESLKRELLGSMAPPKPPLRRTLEAATELFDPDILNQYVQKAWNDADDPASGHPPCSERLNALGYNAPPAIERIQEIALSTLLRGETVEERVRQFDEEWTSRVADHLDT